MGTLLQVKLKMKQDQDMKKKLARGGRHEILLDLDGDKCADLGLMDENMDGDIDAMALDLSGTGDFDLFLMDLDGNGTIDMAFFDKEGTGNFTTPKWGAEVLSPLFQAATQLYVFLKGEDWGAQELNAQLEQMSAALEKVVAIVDPDFA